MNIKRALLAAVAIAMVAGVIGEAAQASGSASYFAVVRPNGNTVRSSGVASSANVSAGTYSITFNRAIDYCSYVASIASTKAGYATVVAAAAGEITVTTFSSGGEKVNQWFSVQVLCAP